MVFVNYGGGGYWFFQHAPWNGEATIHISEGRKFYGFGKNWGKFNRPTWKSECTCEGFLKRAHEWFDRCDKCQIHTQEEAIPHKKQLKGISYRFLMVMNNQEGNGKKAHLKWRSEKIRGRQQMTETVYVYKGTKKEWFSLINCIDSRRSLINLLCSWTKTVREGEIFINHTFWKLEVNDGSSFLRFLHCSQWTLEPGKGL